MIEQNNRAERDRRMSLVYGLILRAAARRRDRLAAMENDSASGEGLAAQPDAPKASAIPLGSRHVHGTSLAEVAQLEAEL